MTEPIPRPVGNVHSPVRLPTHHVGQRVERFRRLGKVGGGSRHRVTELMLTPMVDMFTLLVVYLIQSISSTGEILYLTRDVVLPSAVNGQELLVAPVVTVAGNSVLVDGTMVADISNLLERSTGGDEPLPRLSMHLQELRDFSTHAVEKHGQDPGQEPTPSARVNIQADRALPFRVLKHIVHSCELAGFQEMHLAVSHPVAAAGGPPRR